MSQLEEIKTNTDARKIRSRSQPAPSEATTRQPLLSRVFSAQHIDDHSNYHSYGEHHDQQLQPTTSDDSDFAEDVESEKDRETGNGELRDRVVNERDVEAPLEKTKSSRSTKDPNLVSNSYESSSGKGHRTD